MKKKNHKEMKEIEKGVTFMIFYSPELDIKHTLAYGSLFDLLVPFNGFKNCFLSIKFMNMKKKNNVFNWLLSKTKYPIRSVQCSVWLHFHANKSCSLRCSYLSISSVDGANFCFPIFF